VKCLISLQWWCADLESMSVEVYLSQTIGDVVFFEPQSLISGEPLSQTTGWGSMHQAPESCWWWRCRADVDSSTAEVMLGATRCRYRDDVGCIVISLLSHADDSILEAMLVVTRCRWWVMLMVRSHRWAMDEGDATPMVVLMDGAVADSQSLPPVPDLPWRLPTGSSRPSAHWVAVVDVQQLEY
jgi:hypothetical protein